VIQGIILVVGMLALLVNLLVDVVLGIVDPRTLEGGRRGH
jgi:peptide/nickel transport system permease protein